MRQQLDSGSLSAGWARPGRAAIGVAAGCLFRHEQGVEVCALIHDAVLIAAPLNQLDHDIERMKAAMAKASRVVLDGFELRTDVNVVRYPDRCQDPRGAVMWERVMKLVARREAAKHEVA